MKKAQVDPLKIIIAFIVLLIAAGVLIFIFTTQLGKEKGIVEKQIVGLEDTDDDGVANFIDKCPNTPPNEKAQVDTLGCSPSQKE